MDLLALRTSSPGAWLWRVGGGWALGISSLCDPGGEPVTVVATPLDWLAHGGKAACILDWSDNSPVWSALRAGPSLIVDDEVLRNRISPALRRTAPITPLWRSCDAA